MTHDLRSMAAPFLGVSAEQVQHMRVLAARADPRTATRPPWSWSNLTDEETTWLDAALDRFVDAYNSTLANRAEELIPACGREHPTLAQELPVQVWAGWAAHLDEQSTIFAALEFYNRHLPAFKERLSSAASRNWSSQLQKGQPPEPSVARRV